MKAIATMNHDNLLPLFLLLTGLAVGLFYGVLIERVMQRRRERNAEYQRYLDRIADAAPALLDFEQINEELNRE